MEYKRILIVDDEAVHRDLIKEYLTLLDLNFQYRLKTFEAENGEKCLKLIDRHKPHLVFLDVNMPNGNGLSVLKSLRFSPNREIGQLPVIMTTGHDDKETILECLQLGAKGYLLKPFDLNVFQDKVNAALNIVSKKR